MQSPRLGVRARRMRSAPTLAEAQLWHHLRAARLRQFKFRRQQPLGRFIVDFVCFSRRLIIEVEGGQYTDEVAADLARSCWLEAQGFQVIRFWNHDVLQRVDVVLEEIVRVLESRPEDD